MSYSLLWICCKLSIFWCIYCTACLTACYTTVLQLIEASGALTIAHCYKRRLYIAGWCRRTNVAGSVTSWWNFVARSLMLMMSSWLVSSRRLISSTCCGITIWLCSTWSLNTIVWHYCFDKCPFCSLQIKQCNTRISYLHVNEFFFSCFGAVALTTRRHSVIKSFTSTFCQRTWRNVN